MLTTFLSTSQSFVSGILEITMAPPPVRKGIAEPDRQEKHNDTAKNLMRTSDLVIRSTVEPSKYILFRKEHVSNNTSIVLAEQDERRRPQKAEASTAEQSAGTSRSKNTLYKRDIQ